MTLRATIEIWTLISDNSANDQLSRQMDAFEKEQQQKFKQEIEEHKRQLESQQAQHRNILGKDHTPDRRGHKW